jgi:ABC-type transport system involved in cytochrome c biogenesis permease subunit
MNTKMKKELLKDVVTGLAVAATFASVVPADALAQLATSVGAAEGSIGTPFLTIVSYIAYGLGTVMTVAGIANAKKHADNPGSNPLGPALGRLGAGAAFLAAPSLIGMIGQTGEETFSGEAAFEAMTF